jgi:hypothetical protein
MNRINHQSGLKNRQTREPEPNQQELSIYKNNITARRSNRNNYATKYWSTIQLQSTAEHEQEEGSGTPVPWKRDERALASIGKEILLGRDRREDWVGFVWRGDGEGAGFYRRLRWESVGKNQEESCEATARLTTAGAGRRERGDRPCHAISGPVRRARPWSVKPIPSEVSWFYSCLEFSVLCIFFHFFSLDGQLFLKF